MLTQLDTILYPNDCEVVEIPPHNQFVYLIQKNGTSSIRRDANNFGYTIYKNDELKELENVDIYIRNPQERYLSGINTFVQLCLREYPELDKSTCVWFASKYNFLNRHYLPQWHWVINLSRFIHTDCVIRLKSFEDIGDIVTTNHDAGVEKFDQMFVQQVTKYNTDLKLWLFLDSLMMDLIGKELTWNQLLEYYQNHPSDSWHLLTERLNKVVQQIDSVS